LGADFRELGIDQEQARGAGLSYLTGLLAGRLPSLLIIHLTPRTFHLFLKAFDNKETTIKRLRAGVSNKSNLGGLLQTSNIHILTCGAGQVTDMAKGDSWAARNTRARRASTAVSACR
jgi:hypothetical protein